MRNIRSEFYYCLENNSLVVSLANVADLQIGKRDGSDKIWLDDKHNGTDKEYK